MMGNGNSSGKIEIGKLHQKKNVTRTNEMKEIDVQLASTNLIHMGWVYVLLLLSKK